MAGTILGTTHFSNLSAADVAVTDDLTLTDDATVSGDATVTGTVTATTAVKATTAALYPGVAVAGSSALIVGPIATEGLKTVVLEETVSPAAVETALTTDIPKGAVIRAVLARCTVALTGGSTTVTWSVGVTGDPDKYGTAGHPTQADSLAKNSHSEWVNGPLAQLAADETIVVGGAATGGAADGDTALTVGSVRVVVIYDEAAVLTAVA